VKAGTKHRFQGTLEPPGFVRVPAAVMAALAPRKRVPVLVTINGFGYRTTIATYSDESMVPVRAEIRIRTGANLGDRVSVTIERDDAPRTVEMPAELAAALKKARLDAAFGAMAFTHQKEYVRWVGEAKRPATRARRIAKTLDAIREKAAKR
jgi:hypothetical protein